MGCTVPATVTRFALSIGWVMRSFTITPKAWVPACNTSKNRKVATDVLQNLRKGPSPKGPSSPRELTANSGERRGAVQRR